MSGRGTKKLVQVNVHGAKMSVSSRPVKDLAYDELDYYQEGRNEPVPPDANIVSAVKQRKKAVVMISSVKKTAEERKLTEMRVDACLNKMKRKDRSIPIPAYDPLTVDGSEGGDLKESGAGKSLVKANDLSEIAVMTELELFIDEFKGKSMGDLPMVKCTFALNDQHFAIKIQDRFASAELRELKSKMKEYFSDSRNDTAALQRRMPLTLGGIYVYRVVMTNETGKEEEAFIRVQVMAKSEKIRVFLCDDGFEMDIDTVDDLYPLFPEWAVLPQMACWAQIPPGSNYLKDGFNEYFKKQNLNQSFKILQVGKESVFKYLDALDPVVVTCARIHIIKSADDLQRYVQEA